MAVFHMDIKAHSRSYNVHAIALSSYRSGERLLCDADGRIRNCRRGNKSAVEFTCLVNNRDLSRERLWNKVEAMERRKDAVVAREMELALPCELSLEEQKELSLSVADKIAERYNCAVDVAVHAPDLNGDQRNWHVHLLFSPRGWADSSHTNKEFASKKYRDLNKANAKEEVLYWRGLWEEMVNVSLEKSGEKERVSSLSCEARGELKKYEHIEFNKYQLLRRSGELEDAKKASRLALEISRDELELTDLMEIKNELIKEKEVLLNQLKKIEERKDAELGRKAGEDRRRQSDSTEAESRPSSAVREDRTGTGSTADSQRSEGVFPSVSRDYDQGAGGMEIAAESAGVEATGGTGQQVWEIIKDKALKLWEFLFRENILQRLNPFRKKPQSQKVEQGSAVFSGLKRSSTQEIMEPVYGTRINWVKHARSTKYFMENTNDESKQKQYREISKSMDKKIRAGQDYTLEFCLIRLLGLEAEKAALQRKLEVEKAIKRAKDDLESRFINFRGHPIQAHYRSIVVAREEKRNFFGRLSSSRDVIVGFHKSSAMKNLEESASLSSIEEVRRLGNDGMVFLEGGVRYLQKEMNFKLGWRVYEIAVKENELLGEVLKNKCSSFEIDPSLIKREAQIKEEWQVVTKNVIANFKKNGIGRSDLGTAKVDLRGDRRDQGMTV